MGKEQLKVKGEENKLGNLKIGKAEYVNRGKFKVFGMELINEEAEVINKYIDEVEGNQEIGLSLNPIRRPFKVGELYKRLEKVSKGINEEERKKRAFKIALTMFLLYHKARIGIEVVEEKNHGRLEITKGGIADNLKKNNFKELFFSLWKTDDGKIKINAGSIFMNSKSTKTNEKLLEEIETDKAVQEAMKLWGIDEEEIKEISKGYRTAEDTIKNLMRLRLTDKGYQKEVLSRMNGVDKIKVKKIFDDINQNPEKYVNEAFEFYIGKGSSEKNDEAICLIMSACFFAIMTTMNPSKEKIFGYVMRMFNDLLEKKIEIKEKRKMKQSEDLEKEELNTNAKIKSKTNRARIIFDVNKYYSSNTEIIIMSKKAKIKDKKTEGVIGALIIYNNKQLRIGSEVKSDVKLKENKMYSKEEAPKVADMAKKALNSVENVLLNGSLDDLKMIKHYLNTGNYHDLYEFTEARIEYYKQFSRISNKEMDRKADEQTKRIEKEKNKNTENRERAFRRKKEYNDVKEKIGREAAVEELKRKKEEEKES